MESGALAPWSPVPKAHAPGAGADAEPRRLPKSQPTGPGSPWSLHSSAPTRRRRLVTAPPWGQLFGAQQNIHNLGGWHNNLLARREDSWVLISR